MKRIVIAVAGVLLVGLLLGHDLVDAQGVERALNRVRGHLLFLPDNTYDIGASGATRPRHIYTGGTVTAATQVNFGTELRSTNTGTKIQSPADGIFALLNNAGTDFSRLQFGGTTSSFPSLRRNGQTLDVVLADASAYSPIQVGQVQLGQAILFASLPASNNGTVLYCSDCTVNSAPCAGAGTGAIAKRLATAWRCD